MYKHVSPRALVAMCQLELVTRSNRRGCAEFLNEVEGVRKTRRRTFWTLDVPRRLLYTSLWRDIATESSLLQPPSSGLITLSTQHLRPAGFFSVAGPTVWNSPSQTICKTRLSAWTTSDALRIRKMFVLSVCLSVRLSHAGILSKWLRISLNFLTVG